MKISATTKFFALLATLVIVAPLFSLLAKAPWSNFISIRFDGNQTFALDLFSIRDNRNFAWRAIGMGIG
jgi:hypothetical protein